MILTNPVDPALTGGPDDFFPTPEAEVEKVILAMNMRQWAEEQRSKRAMPLVVDPGAGDGNILATVDRMLDVEIFGIELDRKRHQACEQRGLQVWWGNFLEPAKSLSTEKGKLGFLQSLVTSTPGASWFLQNPPGYRDDDGRARQFVEWSLKLALPGDRVTALIPRQVDCLKGWRHLFLSGSGYRCCLTPNGRMRFVGDGGSRDVAWFTWEKGYTGPAFTACVEDINASNMIWP